VPGHTAGSAALHFARRDTICVGDAFVTLNVMTGTTGPQLFPNFNSDNEQAYASLARFEGVDARLVLAGHGDAWDRGLQEAGRRRSRSPRCRQPTARSRSATSSTRRIPFATARCFGAGRGPPGTRMRRCTPPRASGSRPRRVVSDRPSAGPPDRASFGRNLARTVPYL